MVRHPSFDSRRLRARFVVWAMIALVPMQALAAAALAALGPLHMHRPALRIVVLEDTRRVSSHARSLSVHVATGFGHFHGSAPDRHRHDPGDATVVAIDDGAAALDGGAGPAGAALAAAMALCAEPIAWHANGAAHVRASGAVWAPQTHDPPLPERPPRRA